MENEELRGKLIRLDKLTLQLTSQIRQSPVIIDKAKNLTKLKMKLPPPINISRIDKHLRVKNLLSAAMIKEYSIIIDIDNYRAFSKRLDMGKNQ